MIFGENLLALLVLAIGAALAFGNLMALLRPREQEQLAEGELERPTARSLDCDDCTWRARCDLGAWQLGCC